MSDLISARQRHHLCDPERPGPAGCAGGTRPLKSTYNRFIRASQLGVFNRIFADLAAKGGAFDELMIDATQLKAQDGRRHATAIAAVVIIFSL